MVFFSSPTDANDHCGIITAVYRHRVFSHAMSSQFDLLKVRTLAWERGEYLDRVRIPDDIREADGDEFILWDQVLNSTVCLMPAIESDLALAFTHNALHLA